MSPPSFKSLSLSLAVLSGLVPWVSGLGQEPIVSFEGSEGAFQIVGGDAGRGQILVAENEYWGVIRAAGDLAADFGRVTGTNFTLSNGESDASVAEYRFNPVDVTNNTVVSYCIYQLERTKKAGRRRRVPGLTWRT